MKVKKTHSEKCDDNKKRRKQIRRFGFINIIQFSKYYFA